MSWPDALVEVSKYACLAVTLCVFYYTIRTLN